MKGRIFIEVSFDGQMDFDEIRATVEMEIKRAEKISKEKWMGEIPAGKSFEFRSGGLIGGRIRITGVG